MCRGRPAGSCRRRDAERRDVAQKVVTHTLVNTLIKTEGYLIFHEISVDTCFFVVICGN